jgi:hypothetical protein
MPDDDIFDGDDVTGYALDEQPQGVQRYEVVKENGAVEIREMVIESARHFKTSWVQLGQVLYAVWKDKLFCDWGYDDFEIYLAKEVGLNRKTAIKLLRNYFFLEGEAPKFVQQESIAKTEPVRVPDQDAISVLRAAKSRKDLPREQYQQLKTDALENFKDPKLLKKDLTSFIKQREEKSPEDVRRAERIKILKRFATTLGNLRNEAGLLKILPQHLLDDTSLLIDKLWKELEDEGVERDAKSTEVKKTTE